MPSEQKGAYGGHLALFTRERNRVSPGYRGFHLGEHLLDRTMPRSGSRQPRRGVQLREVEEADLSIFFEQQLDPESNRMAAFTAKDPTDRGAFMRTGGRSWGTRTSPL